MHLELRWLYVTLIHVRSTSWQNSSNDQLDELNKTLELVINDLLYMAMKMFARVTKIHFLSPETIILIYF